MNRVGTRRPRAIAVAAGVVVVALAGWAGWAYAVVQTPRVDDPGPVDAVVVLGGHPGPDRTERALEMVAAGLTDTVVLSMPEGSSDVLARTTCADPPAGVRVVCFRPDPSTTRGEAEEVRRLADERGWDRVAVVTSPYHVSRSRLLVERCFGGSTSVIASHEEVSVWQWAYQYLYQTAGYVKAEVLRGC